MDALTHCPFCASMKLTTDVEWVGMGYWRGSVRCESCGGRVYVLDDKASKAKNKAIKNWNQRAGKDG